MTRVSILIPNYNNGRESSLNGETDLIGDLLQSLHDTLENAPTPHEIIAYDDGSTDDGLDTLRDWAGRGFLKLIEAEHCGVLARTANILVRESSGDILVRLDGDTVMLTPNWAEKLVRVFDDGPPRLGVVGPKQLTPGGIIHAFGDWLLHPKGYHHVAAGLPRRAVVRALEVDHVMGCFYCCKRAVFDELDGYDEDILRGQTIDFGLRARLKGWSCIAVPHVEFVHRHGLRQARDTKADRAEGLRQTLDVFRAKWGFDRLAPDLDAVRERYAGTPLLWNAGVFAAPPEHDVKPQSAPLSIEDSPWGRYTSDEAYRKQVDFRVGLAAQVIQQVGRPRHVAILGGGAGPIAHLLATQGLTVTAVDRDVERVAFAQTCVKNQSYPGKSPTFVHESHARTLPLSDGAVDFALVYDQFERHANPVGLLGEVRRVLTGEGIMVILTARPSVALPSPSDSEHRYHPHELLAQVRHAGGWQIVSDPRQDQPHQPVILVARRRPAAAMAGAA